MRTWSEIEQLVAKNAWEEALELALEEWRQHPEPAYANLVEALSARTPPRAAITPDASHYSLFHRKWLSRAASRYAADADRLLETLCTDLNTDTGRRRFDSSVAGRRVLRALEREKVTLEPYIEGPFMALAERLEWLAQRRPDPRVAKGLLRLLKVAPIKADGALAVATYGPVYEMLCEIRDVRVIPALAALPESAERDRTLARLEERRASPASDRERVQALAVELGFAEPAGVVDVADLLQMVADDPDDDTPRAILGDRWLEANDPRGEFVSLQLKAARGDASEEDLARMNVLLTNGQYEWLGLLGTLTRNRRFVRGFLEKIEIESVTVADEARWKEAALDPRLATVRVLHHGGLANDAVYERFLFSPALKNMEEAEIRSPKMLATLLERPRPKKLRRILLDLPSRAEELPLREVRLLIAQGFERVTIPRSQQRLIATSGALLELATESSSVELTAMDACFVANRTAGGLALDIACRDSITVEGVLKRCEPATVRLTRPRGASLYGANGDSRRLAHRITAMGARATLDASWKKLFSW